MNGLISQASCWQWCRWAVLLVPQGFTSPKVTAVLSLRKKDLAHGSLWQVTSFTFAGVQETSWSYKLNLYSGIHARAMPAPQVFCDILPGCDRALPIALPHVCNMKLEKCIWLEATKEENKHISFVSKGKKNLYKVILHIDYSLARSMPC